MAPRRLPTVLIGSFVGMSIIYRSTASGEYASHSCWSTRFISFALFACGEGI